MNYFDRRSSREEGIRLARVLIVTSAEVGVIAVAALLVLFTVASDPALAGAIQLTAVASGLATAGLALGAARYTQVRGLWRGAPLWFRLGALVLAGLGTTATVVAL